MVEQGASAYSQKILAKQLQRKYSNLSDLICAECQQNESLNASIGLENEHDLFLWNIIFEGPPDTLYDVSIFTLFTVSGHMLIRLFNLGRILQSPALVPLGLPQQPT